MGYNSARYINTVYQAMSLAFADRDFYYGDIYSGPAEPVKGLMSKEYAAARRKLIDAKRNDPAIGPGDPYPFQGEKNPYLDLLKKCMSNSSSPRPSTPSADGGSITGSSFFAGTTSVEAADAEGWVVSVTPSGGWVPAVVAGKSGVGLSQRMQSFVLEPSENPFNVVAPGKQPRVTLTPTLALKDGKPFLSFAVQGGDTQDQNLLQFFLNVVEFGMNVQEASEAANFNSYQMRSSFGAHEIAAGQNPVERGDARLGAARSPRDGLPARVRGADLRPDQRDLVRPRPRHVLGRLEQPRRGLRDCVVRGGPPFPVLGVFVFRMLGRGLTPDADSGQRGGEGQNFPGGRSTEFGARRTENDTMLMRAIHWDDGNVLSFDERGQKIPELCGPYEEVRERVLRDAGTDTKFLSGLARYGITNPVKKEEW